MTSSKQSVAALRADRRPGRGTRPPTFVSPHVLGTEETVGKPRHCSAAKDAVTDRWARRANGRERGRSGAPGLQSERTGGEPLAAQSALGVLLLSVLSVLSVLSALFTPVFVPAAVGRWPAEDSRVSCAIRHPSGGPPEAAAVD